LFFDLAFGLFSCAPLWLLLVVTPLAQRRLRPLAFDAAVLGIPYLVLVASRQEWYGGWSPPFRYPLALLPLLALFLVPLWEERRRPGAAALIALLGTATLVVTVIWLVHPGLTYNFADGRSRLLDLGSAALGGDLARALPSSTRPRLATWVAPVVMIAVCYLLWRWPYPRRASGRARSGAQLAGATALGLLLVGWGASTLVADTRSIEIESPHVKKSDGESDPPEWTFDRRRFREAWVVPEGHRIEAPVVAAGDRVTITIEARFIENYEHPVELVVRAGRRLLGRLSFTQPGVWLTLQLGPVDWNNGESLILLVPRPGPETPPHTENGVAIDRVHLEWHD
jgi:hypothetical protein